jgi:hypothetical protein
LTAKELKSLAVSPKTLASCLADLQKLYI